MGLCYRMFNKLLLKYLFFSVFGMGSVILDGFRLLQFFGSGVAWHCYGTYFMAHTVLRLVFVFCETFFIFKNHRVSIMAFLFFFIMVACHNCFYIHFGQGLLYGILIHFYQISFSFLFLKYYISLQPYTIRNIFPLICASATHLYILCYVTLAHFYISYYVSLGPSLHFLFLLFTMWDITCPCCSLFQW